MERLTEILGFESRYVVYPLAALIFSAIFRWGTHRFLRKWAARTESRIDDKLIGYLDNLVLPLVLLVVLYFLTPLLPFTAAVEGYIQRGLLLLVALLVVFFAAKAASTMLDSLAARGENWSRFSHPLHTLVNVVGVLVAVAASLKILDINLSNEGIRVVRIIGIVAGGYVVVKIIRLAVVQMERMVADEDPTHMSEAEKRANTLGKIINSAGLILVSAVAFMMILSEFGMDITPIITGAGIAGLAVGFGAQNLVRDIIGGFFLILEDQIRVGDVAVINGTGGFVEAIKLRTIVLRDLEGVVHIFPNGEIKLVSNRTKEWSRYVIDLGVAYKEDVDRVMEVLKRIGEELENDPEYSPMILDHLEILGVDNFAESQVTIRIMIKTIPLKQWVVGRELRRRIKKTFDRERIEIPFPHVSVYFGEASRPFDLAMQPAEK